MQLYEVLYVNAAENIRTWWTLMFGQGVHFTSQCSRSSLEYRLLLETIPLLLFFSSFIAITNVMMCGILVCTHATVCCTRIWYNFIMLIIVVELCTWGGFCRSGFCISFIHNMQEVSTGFAMLCNIFLHQRSSKMANELRIFSSCKRIIRSQHQIDEWWICNHLEESIHGFIWVLHDDQNVCVHLMITI
jgi:hypothetical protein